MRAFVSRWAERCSLSRAATFEACLVATEAVTNAIRHAGGDEAIEVRCRLERGELVIEVQDQGTFHSGPADGDYALSEPSDPGGRGLFLIQELTDAFELEKAERGTRVSMRLGIGPGGFAQQATQAA